MRAITTFPLSLCPAVGINQKGLTAAQAKTLFSFHKSESGGTGAGTKCLFRFMEGISAMGADPNVTYTPISISVLAGSISIIIGSRAKKQMIRIRAWRIITMVANIIAVGDRAFVKLIGQTVYQYSLGVDRQVPISIFIPTSNPQPAGPQFWTMFWNRPIFIDLRPKALNSCRSIPMILDKAARLPLYISIVRTVAWGNRGSLAAPALAETERNGCDILRLHGRCTPFVPRLRTFAASLRHFVFRTIIAQKRQ